MTAGTSSDLVRPEWSLNDCDIPLNIVSPTEATLAAPIRCVGSSGTFDFNSWTMSLSADSGSESATGMVMLPGYICPITLAGILNR